MALRQHSENFLQPLSQSQNRPLASKESINERKALGKLIPNIVNNFNKSLEQTITIEKPVRASKSSRSSKSKQQKKTRVRKPLADLPYEQYIPDDFIRNPLQNIEEEEHKYWGDMVNPSKSSSAKNRLQYDTNPPSSFTFDYEQFASQYNQACQETFDLCLQLEDDNIESYLI